MVLVRKASGSSAARYAPAKLETGAGPAREANAEEEEEEEEEAGDDGGARSSDAAADNDGAPPRLRRRVELADTILRLCASPGGALRPLLSRQCYVTVDDAMKALRPKVPKTTVRRALAHLVASGALVEVGALKQHKATRYALATEAPAGADASGEEEAEAEEAAGDAADERRVVRSPSSSSDGDDDDDDAEPPQPEAAAAPHRARPLPARRGAAALVAEIPRLWARPHGGLLPLASPRRSFSWHDVADALRLRRCGTTNAAVTKALSRLVSAKQLHRVGGGRHEGWRYAPVSAACDDGGGGGHAVVAAGDAADKRRAARSSSSSSIADSASSDSDDAEPPPPDAAAAPRGPAALACAITRLWARPRGELLPVLAERRSFNFHDVASALRLPRCRSSSMAVTNALSRLVSTKQLDHVGGDRHNGWRYAPARATNSNGGGCGNAAGAAAEDDGAEVAAAAAEAEATAAAAALPRKRKHPSQGRKARGAPAADWALLEPPPRIDEIGGESAGVGGALRFHLRDSATRAEVCVVDEVPAPAGGCGASKRRVFRITRAGASLAPPSLRAALLPRTSDVRGWMAAVVESRLLGGAEPDGAAARRFAIDPSPEPFSSAGEEEERLAPGADKNATQGAQPPKRLRGCPIAARVDAPLLPAAPAEPANGAPTVAARVEALVSPPHGALYRRSLTHGSFVAADAVAALRRGGSGVVHRGDVRDALRLLVSRGQLTTRADATAHTKQYAMKMPRAEAAAAPARAALAAPPGAATAAGAAAAAAVRRRQR